MVSVTFLVFFEDPFWVGVAERRENGLLRTARVVFGAQPSDREVHAWVLARYCELRFSPPVEDGAARRAAQNPKRRMRQAAEALERGVGTRSQQALSRGREQAAAARISARANRRSEEAERRFWLRQEKKKAKRRGH